MNLLIVFVLGRRAVSHLNKADPLSPSFSSPPKMNREQRVGSAFLRCQVEFEMELRKCKHCDRGFRVLNTSDQFYCGVLCEQVHDPKGAEKRKKKWVERRSVQKKKQKKELAGGAKDISGASKMIQSMPKERDNNGVKSVSEIKNITTPLKEKVIERTERRISPVEKHGLAKTKSDSSEPRGNTMPETKNVSAKSSMQPAVVETQSVDLSQYSETIKREELSSMSLIDLSARDLHSVMRSIVKKHDDNPARVPSVDDVQSICMLASNIKGLMQVKIDAIKAAKEVLKDVGGGNS